MFKLKKSEKLLAIGLGLFIILYFLEKVVLGTLMSKIEVMDVQTKAKEEKYERLLYVDSSKELILKTYDGVKSYLEPDKSESDSVSVIMKHIEELAKDNRINLLKMRPEVYESVSGQRYKIQRITLTIEGSQRDMTAFFYKLENNEYPLTINKLDLRIKDRKLNIMTAEIDVLYMYYG